MSADERLDAVSDELYAGAPADFVARRDALVATARSEGDRALATALKALRRPTVGAWYLNTAARAGLVSLRELLGLGEDLRAAQSGGDLTALRDLAARRGPLVGRVLRDLTRHLAELGVTATPAGLDEVRRTLAAALADPEVADLTRRGRLDRAHDYSGFGPIVPAASTAAPSPPPVPTSDADPSPQDDADRRLAEQRQAAEAALERARAGLEAAEAQRREAEDTLQAARDRAAGLARELQAAQDAARAAEAALAELVDAQDRAGQEVRQAEHVLTELTGD